MILYKQTRAIIKQNVAVTEEADRSMSSLVEQVVGETGDCEGQKAVNINALKQLARRQYRKQRTL